MLRVLITVSILERVYAARNFFSLIRNFTMISYSVHPSIRYSLEKYTETSLSNTKKKHIEEFWEAYSNQQLSWYLRTLWYQRDFWILKWQICFMNGLLLLAVKNWTKKIKYCLKSARLYNHEIIFSESTKYLGRVLYSLDSTAFIRPHLRFTSIKNIYQQTIKVI